MPETKPKLAFFQYEYDPRLSDFLQLHRKHHIKCLDQFFDVHVIQEDCDYQQICDTYEPDLTLIEMLGGTEINALRRLNVSNASACPEIPKLAFLNADAWCESSAGLISDMEWWGVDAAFTVCTTEAEHLPELADMLFVWPNFIDPEVFRDYGESKVIPFLLIGASSLAYPWRRAISKIIAKHYPALASPHHGYVGQPKVSQVLWGEAYARTINASRFVPTCGSVAREIVRKHLEIPACNSCLITEKSAALEAAGFVDMKNCVFATESDVLDKIDYLFRNPEQLNEITRAGHDLVQSQHTLKQRDQIFQWLTLFNGLDAGKKIVQRNPFAPLTVENTSSSAQAPYIMGNGAHLAALRDGDALLGDGKYEAAETAYRQSSNYIEWMPQPKFGMAMCKLHRGDPQGAHAQFEELLRWCLLRYEAVDPDPLEWAYYTVSLLCLGDLENAAKCADEFPWLRHRELDRVRWVVGILKGNGTPAPASSDESVRVRRTIHKIHERDPGEWVEQICIILRACRQQTFAESLQRKSAPAESPASRTPPTPAGHQAFSTKTMCDADRRDRSVIPGGKASEIVDPRTKQDSIRTRMRKMVARCSHWLESKWGPFLPYSISIMRRDEFFETMEELTRYEEIKTAIALGAASGQGTTEAFIAGLSKNREKPLAFYANGATRGFRKLKKRFGATSAICCHEISSSAPQRVEFEVEDIIKKIKEGQNITSFDAMLIDASNLEPNISFSADLRAEMHRARYVFLNGINGSLNFQNHAELLADSNYVLLAGNPGLRGGYAIFMREEAVANNGSDDDALTATEWNGSGSSRSPRKLDHTDG